mmetsp:Transcript_6757/g.21341  ORF Transcript_6757/g.21341 Transcript_6757/m.21341 type:complete len:219 (+) Transcript_6757:348-1004(+)
MAKEPNIVIDPKAKSRANFCGAMTSIGRKDNDMVSSRTPKKKVPANCASFTGLMVSAASPPRLPERPEPALSRPLAATPAAAVAFSRASRALAAPSAWASLSLVWLIPWKSFAIWVATLPFSDRTQPAREPAWLAPSATRPKTLPTSLCQPLAWSAQSAEAARSAACETAPAASTACCRTRPRVEFAHEAHCEAASSPPPFSRSSPVLPGDSPGSSAS